MPVTTDNLKKISGNWHERVRLLHFYSTVNLILLLCCWLLDLISDEMFHHSAAWFCTVVQTAKEVNAVILAVVYCYNATVGDVLKRITIFLQVS